MKLRAILAGIAILGVVTAADAATDADVQRLEQKLEQALQRIDQLEKKLATVEQPAQAASGATAAPAAAPVASAPQAAAPQAGAATADQVAANTAKLDKMSWAERIRIEGDFRYRYQNDDTADPVHDSRNRNRIRARPVIIAMLDPELEVGFGVATGSNNDPISSNQTLGDASADKDVTVDLAYFNWTGVEQTAIRGGRFKNTFQTVGGSQLQWDSDWRPEGGDIAWTNGTFFAQADGVFLESDSSVENSEFGYILQTGAMGQVGPVALLGGVGYTDLGTKGKECYYTTSSAVPTAQNLCYGNQAVGESPDQTYLYDFQVYDVFAQATVNVAGLPLAFFGDYINNSAADDYEQGYLVGAQLGSLKAKGDWLLGYSYEDLESNATLGILTNSDFGGGGTNNAGSMITAGYAVSDKVNFQVTYQLADRNSDHIDTINNGDEIGVDTLQLDLNFKYK
jgi:hypothetical protein